MSEEFLTAAKTQYTTRSFLEGEGGIDFISSSFDVLVLLSDFNRLAIKPHLSVKTVPCTIEPKRTHARFENIQRISY